MLHITCRNGVKHFLPSSSLRSRVKRILRILNLSNAELSILLTGDEEIAELNGLFRHKPYSTDVLSFPQEAVASLPDGFERPRVLGDLVLSLETVARQAKKGCLPRVAKACKPASLTPWTILDEASFLVIHGLLHLLGYDHVNSLEADEMEEKEHELLNQLLVKRR